jgi:hypothetical protein
MWDKQEYKDDELGEKASDLFMINGFYIIVIAGFLINALPLLFIVIALCLYPFILTFVKNSKFFRYKKLLILVSLIGFIHLVVFPLIYVELLDRDPKSFKINTEIANNEKQLSLVDIQREYSPVLLNYNIKMIDSILLINDSKLDTTLRYLNTKGVLLTENHLFYKGVYLDGKNKENPYEGMSPELVVSNNKGKHLLSIYGEGMMFFEKDSFKLREFLIQNKEDLKSSLSDYNGVLDKIQVKDEFWTYSKIFPYITNVLDNSNLIPLTKSSNITVTFHRGIMYIVMLFFAGVFVNHFVSKK